MRKESQREATSISALFLLRRKQPCLPDLRQVGEAVTHVGTLHEPWMIAGHLPAGVASEFRKGDFQFSIDSMLHPEGG
jgi:hypothetical protein